ncbi:hypothetical protein HG530_011175 [Fusarium avenaceum]|nr:hypothetical protein HG530_011175 [Fusarium avenaceum]
MFVICAPKSIHCRLVGAFVLIGMYSVQKFVDSDGSRLVDFLHEWSIRVQFFDRVPHVIHLAERHFILGGIDASHGLAPFEVSKFQLGQVTPRLLQLPVQFLSSVLFSYGIDNGGGCKHGAVACCKDIGKGDFAWSSCGRHSPADRAHDRLAGATSTAMSLAGSRPQSLHLRWCSEVQDIAL